MPNAADGVLRVLPEQLSLSKDEAAAILEIGFLAIAADRKLNNEELAAFRGVAARLKALSQGTGTMSDREFEQVLEGFSGDMDRTVADERLRVVAGQLKNPDSRRLAYKVAYALALCDLDTSDEEFEFDLQLVDALELTSDDASNLEDEVLEAFNSGA